MGNIWFTFYHISFEQFPYSLSFLLVKSFAADHKQYLTARMVVPVCAAARLKRYVTNWGVEGSIGVYEHLQWRGTGEISIWYFFTPGENCIIRIFVFHPDLIPGTSLGKQIQDYTFFGYQLNEAPHISERERKLVLDSFAKIKYELERAIDKHSKSLIVSNIELFLQYCVRFYDRQFITRDKQLKGILERFENLLKEYFQTDKPETMGLPSVAYCATELNLSANYFGDLIKKEAGITAQEYIQVKIIEIAKEKIFDQSKSISEIAYELGFKYPTHFTRLFKQRVGQSPNKYRTSVN